MLCYALHQGKHKHVRLVLSLSVFYLHSAASKNEVVKGSQLRMLLMCLVKVVWRAQTCAHLHSQNTYRILLQAGQRSSYTTLLGALECQSERRKLDSFCCAPTVTCELVGLLLCTLQHCSMKKGCLQKCQAARSQLTSLQDFTLPHSTRLSYAKQLCQKRIPAFPSFEFR